VIYCDRRSIARSLAGQAETEMSPRNVLRIACGAFGSMLMAISSCASGGPPAGYPVKPIRLITSSSPGSPPDVGARAFGERLATSLGQPIVVDNRPGAMGTIALHAVAKAPADGYTLGVLAFGQALAPALLPQLPYDVTRDLSPVAQLAWGSHIMVVRASSPWKSVNDLIAHARARPGEITFASGGNATPAHVAGELLKQRTGVDIRHIAYKGAIAGIAGLLGAEADLMFAATTASGPHIRSGRLRALATPAPQRVSGFPDVPTMVELDTGVELREWFGVVVPARVPRDIVARLAEEIARIGSLSEVQAQLAVHGLEPVAKTGPEAFGGLVRSELGRWSVVVRAAGLRAD
jgi:tripartite-type tricarboxylate transporter receptor subunit TctC